MDEPAVEIIVGGESYKLFDDLTIKKSLGAVCGSFEFSVASKEMSVNWGLIPQRGCFINIHGKRFFTGYIDRVRPSISEGVHRITISGREVTSDLVDCSIVQIAGAEPKVAIELLPDEANAYRMRIPPRVNRTLLLPDASYVGKTVFDLANIFCAPFGIKPRSLVKPVTKKAGNFDDPFMPYPIFAVQKGETVFEALDRASKLRGIVLMTSKDGAFTLSRASSGRCTDALVYGKNIKDASGTYDYTDRFSDYLVWGQDMTQPGPLVFEGGSGQLGHFIDKAVVRFRPKILHHELDMSGVDVNIRSKWEALKRAGKSERFSCKVQGFQQTDGKIWEINHLVGMNIPALFANGQFLIVSATYSYSRGTGSTTQLDVMRPESFDITREDSAHWLQLQGASAIWFAANNLDGTPNNSPKPAK